MKRKQSKENQIKETKESNEVINLKDFFVDKCGSIGVFSFIK